MISPTKRQMDVLRFVTGYQEAHGGVSPKLTEIASSTGDAFRLLAALEERGFIRRARFRHRAIEVLHPPAIPRDPEGNPLYFVEVGQ